MELSDYVRIARKGWALIVGGLALGLGLGVLALLVIPPSYVSTTRVFVSVQGIDQSSAQDIVQGSSAAQQKVTSYLSVATSSRVLQPVVDELRLDTTTTELAERVTATSPANTVIISISARDHDPGVARRIAAAVGTSFTKVVADEIELPVGGGPTPVRVETIEPASSPTSPASPRLATTLGLGLLAGFVLGTGAAALRAVLDTRVRGLADVHQVTDTAVIGAVGFDATVKTRPLFVHTDPRSPRAEAFRSLRTNLQFLDVDTAGRSFVLTSALPAEGKSTTSANLAIAIAETGASVAVVDGDLRRPRLADIMGLDGTVGLTDVLIGRAELTDVLQPWGRGGLVVLAAGTTPPNPSELLGSRAMAALIDELTATFDHVIVDAPPLLPVTDAAVISTMTSGAILVVGAGRATRGQLRQALDVLERIGSRVLGVVATMVPVKGADAYGYSVYSSYYADGDEAADPVVPEPLDVPDRSPAAGPVAPR
ncbi:polysaccharide biosynthesis tyrosine autokinase [Frigoribacterium faeni]|uniref:polysaccharide biosynthesis tyrosine autokinase n=1 Tax=Frigoribacterium faeni TaxID=145483 RepID=UPI00141AE98D|nr:polysaccharide biosynthesis tyrosine autokinase [Frigoribacterium faeni]NIJ05855.1 capsular exopolysaccharide synthesis family protein [Frigoribacterium faeni]